MKIQIDEELRQATDAEIELIESGQLDSQAFENEQQKRIEAIKSSFDKFIALGLTELETSAITGYQPTK